MQTFMFIHGTGVREPAYTACFDVVREALESRLGESNVRLERCYWGEACGTRLFRKGVSIPDFDVTKGVDGDGITDEEYELALWSMLYDNPFAELELLALREPGQAPPPGKEPAGDALARSFKALTTAFAGLNPDSAAELRDLLRRADMLEPFAAARDAIARDVSFRAAMAHAVEPLTDYRLALARAVIAYLVQARRDAQPSAAGYVSIDGATRDRIVDLLVDALGGREMGAMGWIKAKAGRFVSNRGTQWFQRRRGRLTEQLAPVGADILAYQTRPAPFRDFIRDAVNQASAAARARGESGEVVILAHSLGGIAVVDALIEAPLEPVRHLVTLGSQAPLLYELDALGSLPLSESAPGRVESDAPAVLPEHFACAWLNIYDRRDFLSYRAEGIFRERVRDLEVNNRQPFPEAHGAYWTNRAVWDAVTAFTGRRS